MNARSPARSEKRCTRFEQESPPTAAYTPSVSAPTDSRTIAVYRTLSYPAGGPDPTEDSVAATPESEAGSIIREKAAPKRARAQPIRPARLSDQGIVGRPSQIKQGGRNGSATNQTADARHKHGHASIINPPMPRSKEGQPPDPDDYFTDKDLPAQKTGTPRQRRHPG